MTWRAIFGRICVAAAVNACLLFTGCCVCSPQVRPSDVGALREATNQEIHALFDGTPEAFWLRLSPSARSSEDREKLLALVRWWRVALGHCDGLDRAARFSRNEYVDGRTGIGGSMRCTGGLAPARFVFERLDGRLVLSRIEVEVPESVAQVSVDPADALRLANELMQHLEAGGPTELIGAMTPVFGFPNPQLTELATGLGALTGPVQEVTLQSQARQLHGIQRLTYIVRGERASADVRLEFFLVDGETRQSGFQYRPAE